MNKIRDVIILKLLNRLYKYIILMDIILEKYYGIDSQIYLDFHDKLNVLSIDKDRKDTKKPGLN